MTTIEKIEKGIITLAEFTEDQQSFIRGIVKLSFNEGQEQALRIPNAVGQSKRFAIATETTDGIIKGKKYELIESESMGHYIIDESGEETYYNHSSLNVC